MEETIKDNFNHSPKRGQMEDILIFVDDGFFGLGGDYD